MSKSLTDLEVEVNILEPKLHGRAALHRRDRPHIRDAAPRVVIGFCSGRCAAANRPTASAYAFEVQLGFSDTNGVAQVAQYNQVL